MSSSTKTTEISSRYGHFSPDGREFVITNPQTPRAFDNFLWNDAIFSNVQQTGVGYADYQVGDGEAVQLLTGIGRICDFDVFGREGLMSRLVYLRDNDTGESWNVNWEPTRILVSFGRYVCPMSGTSGATSPCSSTTSSSSNSNGDSKATAT
jgi:hypothetical protein